MAGAKTVFNALFDSFLADDFFGPASKTVTMSITSGGTIDPITNTTTGGTTTVYTADGFIRDPMTQEFVSVVGGDLVFTCKQDDLGYTPVFNDEVTLSGGSTWDGTYKVQEVRTDGADVVYKIQLRR